MDNQIIVMTCTFPHEAHMVKAYLESQGIETFLKDEMTVQVNIAYSNAVGGIKILVTESDYDQSIQMLKNGGYIVKENTKSENKIEVIFIDDTTNKNKCPFCSSENVSRKKGPNTTSFILSSLVSLLFTASILPIFSSTYKCFDCEKEWKFKRS